MKALYWIALIFIKIIMFAFLAIMFGLYGLCFLCVKISEALNFLDTVALSICSIVSDFLTACDKTLRTKVGLRK